MANPEHVKLLEQGVRQWNKWRKWHPATQPDLSKIDLSRINLRQANLSRANLYQTNLSRANLIETNLSQANLSNVDLSHASLFEARLIKACLNDANLREANLSFADLSNARLHGATLRGAELISARLCGVDMSTIITGGAFGGMEEWSVDLKGINLSRANLSKANLSGVNLEGIDLSEADLSEAILSRTNLMNANLSGANLSRAYLCGADLSSANLCHADLSGADLSQKASRFFVLEKVSGAKLIGTDLSGANLSGANLNGTALYSANLSSANLNGADLSGASARSTIFANVDLRQVKGLAELKHHGPSHIEPHTLYLPQDGSALHFLRGTGVPDEWIDFYCSTKMYPIQYHSCFISYSSKDEAFACRLHADLQAQGVRCWFAPEDMKTGDKIRKRIDKEIHMHEKLLLLISVNALISEWVEDEVEAALEKERKQQCEVLFPIRLDESIMQTRQAWAAALRRTRHIGDFTRWTEPASYQEAFERLLRDLKKVEDKP